MKLINFKSCIIIVSLFFWAQFGFGITLVYNMKIRRVFNVSSVLKDKKIKWAATVVPIVYKRDRHIVSKDLGVDIKDKRLTLGSLLNLRYSFSKAWWIEASTGLENEHVKSTGTLNFDQSRFGADDIIISGGYNLFPDRNAQIVFYGLAGLPTRLSVTPQEVEDTFVGTRFFSIGAGSEFSYGFINTLEKGFVGIFQNRFLHFFKRSWQPILPSGGKIQPGNVIDLLFALRYRKTLNSFEVGYNPTFFNDEAVILPFRKIPTPNFVRHGYYASFTHGQKMVPVLKTPGIFGIGFSISRSHFFNTRIVAAWVNFALLF